MVNYDYKNYPHYQDTQKTLSFKQIQRLINF
jgi:hypothetical protein